MDFGHFWTPQKDHFGGFSSPRGDQCEKGPTLTKHCPCRAKTRFGRPEKDPKREEKTIVVLLGKPSEKGSRKSSFGVPKRPPWRALGTPWGALGRPGGTVAERPPRTELFTLKASPHATARARPLTETYL